MVNNYIHGLDNESHVVVLKNQGDKLQAYVSFYGDMIYSFEVTNGFHESISYAYVCDWKNRKTWGKRDVV